jgi:hypothetical protein
VGQFVFSVTTTVKTCRVFCSETCKGSYDKNILAVQVKSPACGQCGKTKKTSYTDFACFGGAIRCCSRKCYKKLIDAKENKVLCCSACTEQTTNTLQSETGSVGKFTFLTCSDDCKDRIFKLSRQGVRSH